MNKENKEQNLKTTRINRLSKGEKWRFGIGIVLVPSAIILKLIDYHLLAVTPYKPYLNLFTWMFLLLGLGLLLSVLEFSEYIFDPKSYKANKQINEFIKSLRLRAILFNNLSIVIFLLIILVIATGFIVLLNPPTSGTETNAPVQVDLTVRISSSVLLIFLVQILFRVFKYLLRVAAFYNAKADALEFAEMKPLGDNEKLLSLFTPDQYDMSDVPSPTFIDNLK